MLKELRACRQGSELHSQALKSILNPFTPFYISDHFYGDIIELRNKSLRGMFGGEQVLPAPEGNNLLKTNNLDSIKDGDIIHVQGWATPTKRDFPEGENYFYEFRNKILPQIDKEVTYLFGHYAHSPSIVKLPHTEQFYQFPRGVNGVRPFKGGSVIHEYARALLNNKSCNLSRSPSFPKTRTIKNLPLAINGPTRTKYPTEFLGKWAKGQRMEPFDFFSRMATAQYIISPMGLRPDCYRHWEAIGLGTIPICDYKGHFDPEKDKRTHDVHLKTFKSLFKENMHYCTTEELVGWTKSTKPFFDKMKNAPHKEYKAPNKDYICTSYWEDLLRDNQGIEAYPSCPIWMPELYGDPPTKKHAWVAAVERWNEISKSA